MNNSQTQKDYLWLNLRDLPYFRALLRAVEARFYHGITLPQPTLDLGCGDGHFASIAFERKIDVGIDPWEGPLRNAAKLESHALAIRGLGDRLPFSNHYFSSVVSNSVLEHIPDLVPVLNEVWRVLKPDGLFVFCVPNHRFLSNLSVGNLFDALKLYPLAKVYRRFFNKIARHYHCDTQDVWRERLENIGFEIQNNWDYFSPAAFHIFEWGHYFGFPCLFFHFILGDWILVKKKWNLFFTRILVQPYFDESPFQENGVCTFFITKKIEKSVANPLIS